MAEKNLVARRFFWRRNGKSGIKKKAKKNPKTEN